MPKRNRPIARYTPAALIGGLLLLGAVACGDSVRLLPTPTATATVASNALLDLERYHYAATLTLRSGATTVAVSTDGDYQAPDRHAFTYSTQLPGVTLSQSAVVIGDQVWLRRGDAPWERVNPVEQQAQQLFATAFSPVRPDFLGGPEFRNVRESVRRLPATLELINDVRAEHYQVGAEGEQYFRSFLAQEAFLQQAQDLHWDVWLAADGGWPVRLYASATFTADLQVLSDLGLRPPTTWELRIDISRPNDPQIDVRPPQ